MTEIAIPENNDVAMVAPAAERQPSALMLWAAEAHEASQIARELAGTSFVPASLRGKPADITAAILAGQELGLQPMATLRSIDVIQGTPALRAHAMRGLVQSHGHTVQLVEASDTRVVMRGRRAGERVWQSVEWTIERAQRLGLTGKDQWKKQPKTMLTARATGEICRLIASDVLYAMPYAAEELTGTRVQPGGEAPPVPAVTAAEILGSVPDADVEEFEDVEEYDGQAEQLYPDHEGHEPGSFTFDCKACVWGRETDAESAS